MGRHVFPIVLVSLLASVIALGATGPGTVSYEGRLYDQQGNPSAQTVRFSLAIYNPQATCLLRIEQTSPIDLSLSDGYFSVTIGQGTTLASDPGLSMTAIFANQGTITGANSCSYSPVAGDGRLLRVSVIDSSATTTLSPDIAIGTTPFAVVADSIQGKVPSDFIQPNSSSAALTQANLESVFQTQAKVTELQNLASGTSTKYISSSTTSGTVIPSLSTTPSSPVAGQFWYDSSSNALKYYNGTSAQTLGTSGGSSGITSLTAGTGLTGGTITSSGTIGLAMTGVSSGTYEKVTVDTYGRVTAGATLSPSDVMTGLGFTPVNSAGDTMTGALNAMGVIIGSSTGTISSTGPLGIVTGGSNSNLNLSTSGTGVINLGADLITNNKVGIGTSSPVSSLDVQTPFGSAGSSEISGSYSKIVSTYTGGTYEQPTINGIKGEASIPSVGAYNATSMFAGVRGVFNKSSTSTIYARGYGVYGSATNSASTGQAGTLYGVHGLAENQYGSGVVTSMYGVSAQLSGIGTATTEVAGLLIDPMISSMSTPNAYGIKIKDMNGGSSQYGVYQMGPDDKNYFAGNIGIGTPTPSHALDVLGDIRIGGAMSGGYRYPVLTLDGSNGQNGGQIWTINGNAGGGCPECNFLRIGNTGSNAGNNGVVFAVGPTGQTMIGYHSMYDLPLSQLDVAGGVAIGNFAGSSMGSPAPANGLIVSGNVGIGTPNPTQRLQVGNSGDGSTAIANSWSVFSDARLKTVIGKIPDAGSLIEKLNGYYYTWKSGEDRSRQVGVIAQEVEAVLPEIVKTTNKGIKTVDYSKLSAVLIEAVKELKAENTEFAQTADELKIENQTLKARLEAFENRLQRLEGVQR